MIVCGSLPCSQESSMHTDFAPYQLRPHQRILFVYGLFRYYIDVRFSVDLFSSLLFTEVLQTGAPVRRCKWSAFLPLSKSPTISISTCITLISETKSFHINIIVLIKQQKCLSLSSTVLKKLYQNSFHCAVTLEEIGVSSQTK